MVNLEKRMQEQNNNIQIIKRKDIKKNGVENEIPLENRFNPNHNKDGKFGFGSGGSGGGESSSGGGSSSADKEARIKELEEQLSTQKLGIFGKTKIKNEIEYLKSGYSGTQEEYEKEKKSLQAEKVKKAQEEYEKKKAEQEEYKKKYEEQQKQQYEEYDKFKDDKIESKTSAEKVEDLKEQRKQYDSQEEFEQSFVKLYHGGSAESVKEISKNVEVLSVNEKEEKFGDVSGGNLYGLSTATSQKSAEVFSQSRGNKKVAELYLKKDAKVYKLPEGKHIDNMTYKEVNDILKQGYDVINVGGDENEMRILNPNVIYTKSQIKSAEKNG